MSTIKKLIKEAGVEESVGEQVWNLDDGTCYCQHLVRRRCNFDYRGVRVWLWEFFHIDKDGRLTTQDSQITFHGPHGGSLSEEEAAHKLCVSVAGLRRAYSEVVASPSVEDIHRWRTETPGQIVYMV
jgi:hypothetical protein